MWTWTRCLSLFACALMLPSLGQGCQGDELPRDLVLDWLKRQILEGLGIDEPPSPVLQLQPSQMMDRAVHRVIPRRTRETRVEKRHRQVSSQFILFPSSGESCI